MRAASSSVRPSARCSSIAVTVPVAASRPGTRSRTATRKSAHAVPIPTSPPVNDRCRLSGNDGRTNRLHSRQRQTHNPSHARGQGPSAIAGPCPTPTRRRWPGPGGGPGRAPLPRGPRAQPAQAGPQAHPGVGPEAPRHRERAAGVGRPARRACTCSRRRPTSRPSSPGRRRPTTSAALEKAFVKVARAYGQRKGIEYSAWRAAGVSAAVLQHADIPRTALTTGAATARPVAARTNDHERRRPRRQLAGEPAQTGTGRGGWRPPRATRAGPCRRSTPSGRRRPARDAA